jgi:hypothetical protein
MGYDLAQDLHFMGRSGIKLIKGLRVAFISGLDYDVLCDHLGSETFLGNHFTENDLNNVLLDYEIIVKNDPNKREGVDLLLASQWPLGIDVDHFKSVPLEQQKQVFNASSSSLSALIEIIKPRYIYSSTLDLHHKRQPFKFSDVSHICRFVALGSLPGKHKPEESKQVYIQAIELEPLSNVKDLGSISGA